MIKILLNFIIISNILPIITAKWVEGHIKTSHNWAFLARFCFLSNEGQFEYQIEFSEEIGTPNLLLYYDDESQWPSVYHSNKTCTEREGVLNKKGQNQIIPLSPLHPLNDFSGCVIRTISQEPNYIQSPPTKPPPKKKNPNQWLNFSINSNTTEDPSYFDQFLITTPNLTIKTFNVTQKSEIENDALTNVSTSTERVLKNDFEIFENIPFVESTRNEGNVNDTDILSNLQDVETFSSDNELIKHSSAIIKRQAFNYEQKTIKKFNNEPPRPTSLEFIKAKNKKAKYVIMCHNSRGFRSVRERWWFIAISNCNESKGLDVKYKFLMTNGPPGDYWHEHFSADEFYVLPILMAFCFAYVLMIMAMVMCTIELKARQMLHTTYKLFVCSVSLQQSGILLQSLAYVRYAVDGIGADSTKIFGQSLCGASETTYLLLLVLMAKGYTITRARLKLSFTVKLTVFMCCYSITFTTLFIYQAKEFDPGEVLYLYESPAGYGLIILRICAWGMFVYAIVFTIKKYPEKSVFYYPFSLCGTMWFYAGPLFILTANNYIDKWVRESVVTAILLLITFCGHITFLLLTLPVFANKNFPYHVRTTQIGVMEVAGIVAGNSTMENFGHNIYMANSNGVNQSVIIPLTRRTEELINTTNHVLASAPPLNVLSPIHKNGTVVKEPTVSHISNNGLDLLPMNNMGPKLSISTQHSAESVSIGKGNENDKDNTLDSLENRFIPQKSELTESLPVVETGEASILPFDRSFEHQDGLYKSDPNYIKDISNPFLVRASMRNKRSFLEPIKHNSYSSPPPSWSLAKCRAKDKNKKTLPSAKSAETDYKLQGVIGTFPLPQMYKNNERNNTDGENGKISPISNADKDSFAIVHHPNDKLDDITLSLFSVKNDNKNEQI